MNLSYKFYLGILTSILCVIVLVFYSEANIYDIKQVLREVSALHMVASAMFLTLSIVYRSKIWKELLGFPVDANDPTFFAATVLASVSNFSLPIRSGDFIRSYALNVMRPDIPISHSIGATLIERFLDLIILALLLFLLLFLSPYNFEGSILENINILKTAISFIALVILILSVILYFIRRKHWLNVLSVFLSPLIPSFILNFFSGLIAGLLAGTKNLKISNGGRRVIVHTGWTWIFAYFSVMMGLLGMDIPVTFFSTLITLVAMNVAFAIPSAPGAIGTFHLSVTWALTSSGLQPGLALGFSIVYWFISFSLYLALSILVLYIKRGVFLKLIVDKMQKSRFRKD